jgi:hypothetical protein
MSKKLVITENQFERLMENTIKASELHEISDDSEKSEWLNKAEDVMSLFSRDSEKPRVSLNEMGEHDIITLRILKDYDKSSPTRKKFFGWVVLRDLKATRDQIKNELRNVGPVEASQYLDELKIDVSMDNETYIHPDLYNLQRK